MEPLNTHLFNSLFSVLAYIDPGSGSAIISAVIGFFVAASLAIKTYWYKIKNLITGGKSIKEDVSAATSED